MLCSDTQTQDIWLKSDAQKPKDSRPVLVILPMTHKAVAQVKRLVRVANDPAVNEDDTAKALSDAIHVGVRAFRNVVFRGEPVVYTKELDFASIFHASELWELATNMLRGVGMTEETPATADAPPPPVTA